MYLYYSGIHTINGIVNVSIDNAFGNAQSIISENMYFLRISSMLIFYEA